MSFDIVAFAKRVHNRFQLYERMHGVRPKITPTLSRILENDSDYIPYRVRAAAKQRRPADNPSIRTVVAIAEALECSVGELLGEITITHEDVKILHRVGQLLDRTFHLRVPE